MAKSENQKLKILYLLEMLWEETDEEHPLSTKRIIEKLEKKDIKAERKSIYADIEALQDFGFDIILKSGRGDGGYYLASRDFELAELKLLVDAVLASRFITENKSRKLIEKLERLTSKHQGGEIKSHLALQGRAKTENEKIYYSIDAIYKAINENKKLSFTYLDWALSSKKLEPRKKGEKYIISPWSMVWDDDNYYLIGYDSAAEKIKHYRVDKIKDAEPLSEKRDGRSLLEDINLAEYTKKTFGMYGGTEKMVSLRLPDYLFGVMMDRFGKDISVRKLPDGYLAVRIKAVISRQFFGWLCGLGKDVTIQAPDDIKAEYTAWLNEILKAQKEG